MKLATVGQKTEEDLFEGYLYSVYENIDHDIHLLRNVCNETNFAAEIRAALLIAQTFRFVLNENVKAGLKATRPREVLPSYADIVERSLSKCGIPEPNREAVRIALEGYQMFSDGEIKLLLNELPEKLNKQIY